MRKDQAREELLAAAHSFVSSRLFMDSRPPGPDDDAEMEIKQDYLDEKVRAYASWLLPG